MIAANRPMTPQEVSTLGIFRGRVETAWEFVQAYAAKGIRSSSGRHGNAASR